MNDNFTPTDSDLVFRRKERWVLVIVAALEALIFGGIFVGVILKGNPTQAPFIGAVFLANLLFLGGLAFWMWTYEVRITPYELVIRSCFGIKAIPFSMITQLERTKVQGKTPETFQLKLVTSDGAKLALPDAREGLFDLHTELKARCKALARMEEKILEP